MAITQSLPEREEVAPVQLTLSGDEERVYLVGVEIRERKKAKSVFTGALALQATSRHCSGCRAVFAGPETGSSGHARPFNTAARSSVRRVSAVHQPRSLLAVSSQSCAANASGPG